jgi:hypothetical protein
MTADQDVFAQSNGIDGGGNQLPYAKAALFYDANIFGLSKDYAFPEGANVAASRWDQITSLAKLLARRHKHVDGNEYDAWDALQTCLKYVLAQNPHINDDEKNSVNYKAPAT